MKLLHMVAYASVTYSITGLLIILGLLGKTELAADIGIAQGATLATFYALSANARTVILTRQESAGAILFSRVILVVPLAWLSYFLSVYVANADSWVALAIIVRRSVEWINEIHLSEAELKNTDVRFFPPLQIALFVLTVFDIRFLYIWAFAPLFYSLGFLSSRLGFHSFRSLIPHFGSTTVMGVSLYAFRLMILLIVPKSVAGALFSAFSIGSFLGTFFGNVVGPSLMTRNATLPRPVIGALWAWGILGLALLWVPQFFWHAVGLSLTGGAIMIAAQSARIRLLKTHDVLGPDLISHLMLLFCVPFVYFLWGKEGMAALYLINAGLLYAFYRGAELKSFDNEVTTWIIGGALLFPLFFQLSGAIYNSALPIVDSGGVLTNVPIPISVLACYGGVLALGAYRKAYLGMCVVATMLLIMVLSSSITASDITMERRKFILLLQFILPVVGLILGQMVSEEKIVHKAFLYVLAVIVPAQLISTWAQGHLRLTHNLYVFGVYQHEQYVPLMFVSAFMLALISLWGSHKRFFAVLGPLMGIYVAAANSLIAMGALIVFVAGFAANEYWKTRTRSIVVVALATVLCFFAYFNAVKNQYVGKYDDIVIHHSLPKNLRDRYVDWARYSKGIVENRTKAFFGHAEPPSREVATSAHNYYLDLIYNFGFISSLPILALVAYTLFLLWRRRAVSGRAVMWNAAVVLYLVVVDNNFKVSFRQPYPGIITFFLWGLLIQQMSRISPAKAAPEPYAAAT